MQKFPALRWRTLKRHYRASSISIISSNVHNTRVKFFSKLSFLFRIQASITRTSVNFIERWWFHIAEIHLFLLFFIWWLSVTALFLALFVFFIRRGRYPLIEPLLLWLKFLLELWASWNDWVPSWLTFLSRLFLHLVIIKFIRILTHFSIFINLRFTAISFFLPWGRWLLFNFTFRLQVRIAVWQRFVI